MDFSTMSDAELEAIANGTPASPAAAPAAGAQASAPADDFSRMSDEELQKIVASAPAVDKSKPIFANGSSPETALNKPLMSSEDTFSKIGIADKAGSMKALQKQYGQDNVVANDKTGFPSKVRNPSDGLWYNVDPASPWDKSWEAVKVIAKGLGSKLPATEEDKKTVQDAGKALGGVAAVGIGALSGGLAAVSNAIVKHVDPSEADLESNPFKIADKLVNGLGLENDETSMAMRSVAAHPYENANLAAQAITGTKTAGMGFKAASLAAGTVAGALSGARTLLGKLEGTFDGTPADMAVESGMEAITNMAGTIISLGVMPTAKFLAGNAIPRKVGNMLSGLASDNLAIFKATLGKTAGLAPEVIDTLAKDGSMVNGLVNEVASIGHAEAKQTFGARSANRIVAVGKELESALPKIYQGQTKALVTNTPKEFDLQPAHVVDDMMHSFMKDDGIVRVVDKAGAPVDQVDVMNMLAKNGQKLPKGMNWEMTPRSELMTRFENDPSMSKFAKEMVQSPEAHKAFSGFINEAATVRRGAVAPDAPGRMRSILDLRSQLNNLTWKTKVAAEAAGESAVAGRAAQISQSLDSSLEKHLAPYGEDLVKNFQAVNQSYAAIKQTGEQFLDAAKQGPSSGAAMRMSRSVSRDTTVGDALAYEQIQALQSALHTYGGDHGVAVASKLSNAARVSQAERAAVEFSAPTKWGLGSVGGVALAAASPIGMVAKGAAMAGAAAAQSPKVAYRVAGANLATARFMQKAGLSKAGDAVGAMSGPKVLNDALRADTINKFMPVLGKIYINMTHTPGMVEQGLVDHVTGGSEQPQ